MKTKLEERPLKERITRGFKSVIYLMYISGGIALVVILFLMGNMTRYIGKVQRADTAVKICRIDVTAAAKDIREMALIDDASAYDSYEQNVLERLDEVNTELLALQDTGVVTDELYNQYADALQTWGNTGYAIMSEIKDGDIDQATDQIINECTPMNVHRSSIRLWRSESSWIRLRTRQRTGQSCICM